MFSSRTFLQHYKRTCAESSALFSDKTSKKEKSHPTTNPKLISVNTSYLSSPLKKGKKKPQKKPKKTKQTKKTKKTAT